jgi:hypothetical protein
LSVGNSRFKNSQEIDQLVARAPSPVVEQAVSDKHFGYVLKPQSSSTITDVNVRSSKKVVGTSKAISSVSLGIKPPFNRDEQGVHDGNTFLIDGTPNPEFPKVKVTIGDHRIDGVTVNLKTYSRSGISGSAKSAVAENRIGRIRDANSDQPAISRAPTRPNLDVVHQDKVVPMRGSHRKTGTLDSRKGGSTDF